MELYEAIAARHCSRSFKDEPISDEIIERLLEAAAAAPSAGNLEARYLYAVKSPGLIEELAKATGQRFVGWAPFVIVFCANVEAAEGKYGERGRDLYCLQDASVAAQNLFLAATAEGLAACWVGAFEETEVAEVLDIPAGLRPVAIIPVGHPDRETMRRPKKPLGEVVEWR